MEQQYNFGQWGPTSEEILRTQYPLHRACRDGDLETLSLLLVEAQHGVYEEDSFYGWTPAHWAAYFGKLSCLMRLLDVRLECDVSSKQLNQTPMHIAAFAGRSHCLKWLLHCGAKLDRQLACLRKLLNTTRVGVNCNVCTSRFCQTPIHLAAFGGHPQCLLWLVSANADMNVQDYLGETAVHKAARSGSIECLSLLVSHGARLYIHSNSGQTAAQLSASCGHQETTRYLVNAAQSQESQARGVYAAQPDPNARTTPAQQDVTTKVHPCVIAQGINAGRLPPAGPQGDAAPAMTDECPMEEAEPTSAVYPGGDRVNDVTLNQGVSANVVSIAGRKRCREEADDGEHKRRRSDFSLGGYNTLHNGHPNGSCEDPVVSETWNGVSAMSAPVASSTFAPMSGHNMPSTFSSMGKVPGHLSAVPANGHVNGHSRYPSNGLVTPMHNGNSPQSARQMFNAVISQEHLTNGRSVSVRPIMNGSCSASSRSGSGELLPSSVDEHRECVMSERGYDSMLHDNLITCSME